MPTQLPVPVSSPPLTQARVPPNKPRSAARLPPAVRARPRLLKGVRPLSQHLQDAQEVS